MTICRVTIIRICRRSFSQPTWPIFRPRVRRPTSPAVMNMLMSETVVPATARRLTGAAIFAPPRKRSRIYLQYSWSGDLGGMPANLHLGVRHEETDITSAARDTVWAGSSWVGAGNEFTIEPARDDDGNIIQGFTDVLGNYDVTLPSLDFDIEPWENIVLRASFSETITRPSYDDIKGGLAPEAPFTVLIKGCRRPRVTRVSFPFNRNTRFVVRMVLRRRQLPVGGLFRQGCRQLYRQRLTE